MSETTSKPLNPMKPITSKRSFNKTRLIPYILVAPAVISLVIFVIYPIFYMIYLSLTSWNLLSPTPTFIGMENFKNLFTSKEFIEVLRNTFIYSILIVSVTLTLALLFALWFNKTTKFHIFAQGAMFTPHIISLVSVSLVWMWLMDPDIGFLNFIFKLLHLPPSPWLTSSKTALISIVIVSAWKGIGYYALVMIAGLQSIPKSIYEAAALDDASKWRVFYKITLPMLSPTLFFLLITSTIGSFQVFDTINIMTEGGPVGATNMLVYFIYENAFKYFKIGYASSAGVVLLVIVGLITIVYFKMLSKKVHYQ